MDDKDKKVIDESAADAQNIIDAEANKSKEQLDNAMNKVRAMRAADLLLGMKRAALGVMHIANKYKGNYKVACLEMRKYCQVVIDTANKVKEMEEQNATGQVSEPVREVQ